MLVSVAKATSYLILLLNVSLLCHLSWFILMFGALLLRLLVVTNTMLVLLMTTLALHGYTFLNINLMSSKCSMLSRPMSNVYWMARLRLSSLIGVASTIGFTAIFSVRASHIECPVLTSLSRTVLQNTNVIISLKRDWLFSPTPPCRFSFGTKHSWLRAISSITCLHLFYTRIHPSSAFLKFSQTMIFFALLAVRAGLVFANIMRISLSFVPNFACS